MVEISVFVTNLGKYNEGKLIGEWVDLPVSNSELEEVLERIGIDDEYEEYFITDYEAPFKIDEYDNLDELNDLAERIDALRDADAFVAALQAYDIDEAIERVEKGDYISYAGCCNMGDVAFVYLTQFGCVDFPEWIRPYFDFDAYGRDMEIDSTFCSYNDNYYEFLD